MGNPSNPQNCHIPALANATYEARLAILRADNIIHLAAMGQMPRAEALQEYHQAMVKLRAAIEELDHHALAWTAPPGMYPAPAPIQDAYELTQQTKKISQLEA